MRSCSKTCLELKPDFDKVQSFMQTNQRELAAQLYFHAVMPLCPPLLRLWLTQDFPDPRRWLAARTTYTETTALWSIAGYVIGLGDRHNDNILIQRSGAVSHIDFDCIFEKGTILPTPEVRVMGKNENQRVPFRLTPNIIDAFGVSGVEGTFRCTCEIAMRCMRENRDLVMSVLESLLYISCFIHIMHCFLTARPADGLEDLHLLLAGKLWQRRLLHRAEGRRE